MRGNGAKIDDSWPRFPRGQSVVTGDICGPVRLRFESFRQVLAEVLFIDMQPSDNQHNALLGYIPLEQAQAVVDLTEHRLARVQRVDLKSATS